MAELRKLSAGRSGVVLRVIVALLSVQALAAVRSRGETQGRAACRVAMIEGDVTAGHPFERSLGEGLKLLIEPIASGWIVRVVPEMGPRGRHDYAELATPPYRSVSPLLVSTDFSLRAQDALAWNPRHFRFATGKDLFEQLAAAYEDVQRQPPGNANLRITPADRSHEAESRLGLLVTSASEAKLTILDAHFVPGTADQVAAAALVATHPNQSAREVDQPENGRTSPLGRINWIRFSVKFNLPQGFRANRNLQTSRSGCL